MTVEPQPESAEMRQRAASAARAVSQHAYCPYSRFPVGAAALTADGNVYTGCNVENGSYGLTICAERAALAAAVAAGDARVLLLALYTPTQNPTTPCGACRQVIAEIAPGAAIYCFCDGDETLLTDAAALLPSAFSLPDL